MKILNHTAQGISYPQHTSQQEPQNKDEASTDDFEVSWQGWSCWITWTLTHSFLQYHLNFESVHLCRTSQLGLDPLSWPIQLRTEENVKWSFTKTEYKDRKSMSESLFHFSIHGLARGLTVERLWVHIKTEGLNSKISHNEAKNKFKLLFSKAKKKRKIKQWQQTHNHTRD